MNGVAGGSSPCLLGLLSLIPMLAYERGGPADLLNAQICSYCAFPTVGFRETLPWSL